MEVPAGILGVTQVCILTGGLGVAAGTCPLGRGLAATPKPPASF